MIVQVAKFSERLIEAMDVRDIKAIELSEKTGISQSTISQYRSGYAEPKRNKLKILSDALHVNPSWLLGLDVSMESEEVLKDKLVRAYMNGDILNQIAANECVFETATICLKLKHEHQQHILETAKILQAMEYTQTEQPQTEK